MNNMKIILILIGIFLCVSIVIGISYAVWLLTSEQTNQNVVATECFDISFSENVDSNINLQNTYPVADNIGVTLTPYTFSITNTCDLNALYYVNLEILDTTTLSHDLIKAEVDAKLPSVVSNKKVVTSIIPNSTAYNLDSFYIAPNETKNHELRMWVDDSATLDNSQNKLVEAKMVISGEPVDNIPMAANPDELLHPVFDSNMIPVIIEENTGKVTIVNPADEYYSYNYKEWANAVIVDPSYTTLDIGDEIPMEYIDQMYVWIPRYEYSKSSIVNANTSFDVTFVGLEKTSTTDQVSNDDIIVHPAFCWGNYCQTNRDHADNIELSGIWVGKFEPSWEEGFVDVGNDEPYNNNLEVNYLIKPNTDSVHNTNLSTMFNNTKLAQNYYNLDIQTDIHIIKNLEWGAVAYLSQSKYGICSEDGFCNVKVESNNYEFSDHSIISTGCGSGENRINTICPETNRWNTPLGQKASTTHNITGIFDMAGGRWEFAMGIMDGSNGVTDLSNTGFNSVPEAKYFDSYDYGTTTYDIDALNRGLYGDGSKELYDDEVDINLWNRDMFSFMYNNNSIIARSGIGGYSNFDGIWYISSSSGNATNMSISTRISLIVEN